MAEQELEQVEKINIKSAKEAQDKEILLGEVLRTEAEAWPEEIRAPREKFVSRLEIFPEGFFLAYVNGKLAGVSTSERIQFDPNFPPKSWEEITDNGFIKNSHDPRGNALYVVSVGVADWAQGRGLGGVLVKAQKELVQQLGLDHLVLGARLSGYHNYHKDHSDLSAENYAQLINDRGEPQDPEIRFYTRQGLAVREVSPNYMEDDPESENFGVVMVWENK